MSRPKLKGKSFYFKLPLKYDAAFRKMAGRKKCSKLVEEIVCKWIDEYK
jgi:hypothetical protein